jgi:hypothetical protein
VSIVSALRVEEVEAQGRLQSAAAACAARLAGEPDQRVALMLAFLAGYQAHQQKELADAKAALERASNGVAG